MAESGVYGTRMAAYFHLETAPSLTVSTARRTQLAVTRLRSESGLPKMSTPIPAEKAFLVSVQLREVPSMQLWLGKRLVSSGARPRGAVSIVDLEQEPTVFTADPFDCVQFYFPRAALDELAYEHGGSRVETLSWPHGKADANLHHLAMSLLPAIEHPEGAARLFAGQVTLAVLAYCAHKYGEGSESRVARGGLAPWQMRRATELLRERLDSDLSLSELAAECQLSVSHFVRSFKQAIGQTPHRWMTDRRVDAAKHLMLNSRMGLSEIALDCGFSDQTSFSRAFKRVAGIPPGDWRRLCRQ